MALTTSSRVIRNLFLLLCVGVMLFAPQAALALGDGAATGSKPPAQHTGKWIEVVLSQQRLNAWDNGKLVMSTAISSGTRNHPTVRGTFRIYRKYRSARMRGPGYDLPHVPYVMYFTGSYGLHGTYWHSNFGAPMSHGCVNLPTGKAAWLFRWAPSGTTVVIH